MSDSFYRGISQANSYFYPDPENVSSVNPHSGVFRSDSLSISPVSVLNSFNSIQPQTAISSSPLTTNSTVLFNLKISDYTGSLFADLRLANTTGSAVNFRSYRLFERIEWLDSSNNILSTVYSNDMLYKFLFYNQFHLERASINEYMDPVALAPKVIPANTTIETCIKIPGWVTANTVSTDQIKNGVSIRFYVSSTCCDTPASINITQFNLISVGQKYSASTQAKDYVVKFNSTLGYRFLTPTRALETTIQLNPSQSYNLQITSGRGLCAYLVLTIRASPNTFTDDIKFYPIANMEFRNAQNTIQGINLTNQLWQSIANQSFPGYILQYNTIQTNSLSNIYIIDFALSPTLAQSGSYVGSYDLTGQESLFFTMPSTFTAGVYDVNVHAFNYATALVNNGNLTVVNSD